MYFLGNQIFIHGGISEEHEFLNDCHLMNTSPIKWSPCSVNIGGPSLAWHSACLVLPTEIANNPRTNIYKLPDEKMGLRRTYAKVNYLKIIY